MKLALVKASTDVTLNVFIQNSSVTTGAGLTGLTFETASLVCYYVRPRAAAAALTLATQTATGAHSDGGFVEIDATNMPGFYRLDLSDAVCATGVDHVALMLKGATNMAPLTIEIQLTSANLNDAVRGGMTALPAAVPGEAGGVFIAGTNAATSITTALTANITGAITGSLSGSVGSVTAVSAGAITNASFNADVGSTAYATNIIALAADKAILNYDAPTKTEMDSAFAGVATAADVAALILATPAYPLATNATGQVAVGTIANDAITAASINTGAFTADAFAADAIIAATLATGAISADAVAADAIDLIWDELIETDHQTSGSAGKKLDDAGASADPLASLVPGSYGAGTAGKVIGDYINSSVAAVKVDTAAIKVKTDYLPSATAGTNGGVFIAGTNAATAITTGLTTTFTGNLTGSVGSVTGSVGSVAGNVVGSVGSVTGAVGSVTGAVGSVTGNVGGNVVGSVASVVGAVGSVAGNVVGSVASVTGAVGSVTGAVGSVTGNVGGNVLGSVATCAAATLTGDLTATMKASVNTEVDNALNTAIPGSPVADSINERMVAIDAKLPSKAYLTGTTNSDGDIQMNEATGDYAGTVATVTTLTTWKSIGLKKATEYANFHFVMRDSTNHLPATGKTVTANRTIDAGTEGSCTNAVAETANGEYRITLSAADLNGDSIMFRFSEAACDTLFVHVKTQS